MTYGIIYRIINRLDGKRYVGQTVQQLSDRWKEHLSYVSWSERPLYRAIRKHGLENFFLEQLAEATSQVELDAEELRLGEENHALAPEGYCLKLGEGRGRHCEETKEKIRKKRREQDTTSGKPSPRFGTGKTCEGTCPCAKTFRSYEGRKYCSQKCYGKHNHDLLVTRFSRAGARATSKKIRDTKTGQTYESARACAREVGIAWGSFRKIMAKDGRFIYVEKEDGGPL